MNKNIDLALEREFDSALASVNARALLSTVERARDNLERARARVARYERELAEVEAGTRTRVSLALS